MQRTATTASATLPIVVVAAAVGEQRVGIREAIPPQREAPETDFDNNETNTEERQPKKWATDDYVCDENKILNYLNEFSRRTHDVKIHAILSVGVVNAKVRYISQRRR